MCRRSFLPAEAGPATHLAMSRVRSRWRYLCGEILVCLIEALQWQADGRKQRTNRVLQGLRHQWAQWRKCTTYIPRWAEISRDWTATPTKRLARHAEAHAARVAVLKDLWVDQAVESEDLHLELVNTGARQTSAARSFRQEEGRWVRRIRRWVC